MTNPLYHFSVCTLPPEYCEFAGREGDIDKCKKWLQEKHPDLYEQIYPEVEGEEGDGTTAKKKGKKKVKFAEEGGQVRVIKQKRGGKKIVSSIIGLDKYGCNLETVAKQISKRCGTGAAAMLIEYRELKVDGI